MYKAFITSTLAVLLLTTACSSSEPKDTSRGVNYFRRGFRCKKGPVKQETHFFYKKLHTRMRNLYAVDNLKRKKSFAVLTGESTAQLFTPPMISRFLPGIDLVNRGIGGETTPFLLKRLEVDVLSLKPKVIVIAAGGNDVLRGRCLYIVAENMGRIVQMIRTKAPKTKIVLLSVPPVMLWKANSIIPHYNMLLEELAARTPQVSYIDLWPALANYPMQRLANPYQLIKPGPKKEKDDVHFNAQGYKKLAELLKPHLK